MKITINQTYLSHCPRNKCARNEMNFESCPNLMSLWEHPSPLRTPFMLLLLSLLLLFRLLFPLFNFFSMFPFVICTSYGFLIAPPNRLSVHPQQSEAGGQLGLTITHNEKKRRPHLLQFSKLKLTMRNSD